MRFLLLSGRILILLHLLAACSSARPELYSLRDIKRPKHATYTIAVAIAPALPAASPRIEDAIARHFDHVRLFAKQVVVNSVGSDPNPETLQKLKAMGYDAMLVCAFTQQTGSAPSKAPSPSSSAVESPAVGLGFLIPVIPITLLAIDAVRAGISSATRNTEGTWAYVELKPVRLLETATGKTLWEGDTNGSAFRDGKADIAEEAVRAAVSGVSPCGVPRVEIIPPGRSGYCEVPERLTSQWSSPRARMRSLTAAHRGVRWHVATPSVAMS